MNKSIYANQVTTKGRYFATMPLDVQSKISIVHPRATNQMYTLELNRVANTIATNECNTLELLTSIISQGIKRVLTSVTERINRSSSCKESNKCNRPEHSAIPVLKTSRVAVQSSDLLLLLVKCMLCAQFGGVGVFLKNFVNNKGVIYGN